MIRAWLLALSGAALVFALGIAPAVAQEGVSGSNDPIPVPPTVSGGEVTPDPGGGGAVDVSGESTDPSGTLPFTGTDAVTLVGIALAALASGGLLLVAARRRAERHTTEEMTVPEPSVSPG